MKTDDTLDEIFGALAHSTRRALLERLRDGEAHVNELAAPHDMSLPAISRHLKVLEQAGLIGRGTDGKFRTCHLIPDAALAASDWLETHRSFWNSQFNALDHYVQNMKPENEDE